MAGWAAVTLASAVSLGLVSHFLAERPGVDIWWVLTEVVVVIAWFAALSIRDVVPGGLSRAEHLLIPLGGAVGVGDRDLPLARDDRKLRHAERPGPAQLVAATMTGGLGLKVRELAPELNELNTELAVSPEFLDAATGQADRDRGRMLLIEPRTPQYRRARSISKMAFDIAFAVVAVAVAALPMIAIASAIRLTSRGPVFYVSERIGLDGIPFRMVKFRSMYTGADRDTAAMIASAQTGPVFFKVKADPRVTPVGRFIRKYSLDELPQFFNVLSGDMSIVGPRPQVQREVDAYDATMRRRLLVKPGITGQWQVSGRSNLSLDESIRHDLSYVDNWSMGLDLRIIAKTIGAVARSEGAY